MLRVESVALLVVFPYKGALSRQTLLRSQGTHCVILPEEPCGHPRSLGHVNTESLWSNEGHLVARIAIVRKVKACCEVTQTTLEETRRVEGKRSPSRHSHAAGSLGKAGA
jgi:hypothetical protein